MSSPPPAAPPSPSDWTDPRGQVPRQGQRVLIRRHGGVVVEGVFKVHHTQNWPSGASWSTGGTDADLAFEEVAAWRPLDGEGVARTATVSAPPAIAAETLREVATTVRVLRVLPDYALDWRPHADLRALGELAAHVVHVVERIRWILSAGSAEAVLPSPPTDDPAALRMTLAEHAAAIESATERLDRSGVTLGWTLRHRGAVLATLPRGDALRLFGIGPLVHFRSQLALYLGTLGISIPSLYAEWEASIPEPSEPPGWVDAPDLLGTAPDPDPKAPSTGRLARRRRQRRGQRSLSEG